MKTAVLLPTIYRPDGLSRAISSLLTTWPFVDVYVAMEIDDHEAARIAGRVGCHICICDKKLAGPAYAWNTALREARRENYDLYFLGSDDIEFMPDWYGEALSVLHSVLNDTGMVGVNDGSGKYERAGFVTQYLMTRDFIVEHNGGIAAYPYPCDFSDVETTFRAKQAGKFAYAPRSKVIHHWREVDDDAYRRADAKRKLARILFSERKRTGFPDDVERILT